MTATSGGHDVGSIDYTNAERVIVRVESRMSDEQLIAAGRYNDVWSNILTSWQFELGKPFVGEQEMLVVRADKYPYEGRIYARKGVEIMKDYGFRPPTLREMLAFGAQDFPGKWLGKDQDYQAWAGSQSKWHHVIGANLHYRDPDKPWYDCAPAIWSHGGQRGLTVASLYNAMIGAWPRNPHYLDSSRSALVGRFYLLDFLIEVSSIALERKENFHGKN
jgi:hypothetical protein